MTGDQTTIDYEALAQDAMRGVIRSILQRVSKTGLPGDHHFYISFDTLAPGVSLSKRLKEKYPEEMTIVLQHRFWDLLVSDERFEVKLTFDGIPERLVVPFAAIKVFFDPSVRYGLQFESPDFGPDATLHPIAGADEQQGRGNGSGATPLRPGVGRGATERKPRAPRKPRVEKPVVDPVGADEAAQHEAGARSAEPKAEPREHKPSKPADEREEAAAAPASKPTAPVEPARGAQVVSLDAFRKK